MGSDKVIDKATKSWLLLNKKEEGKKEKNDSDEKGRRSALTK